MSRTTKYLCLLVIVFSHIPEVVAAPEGVGLQSFMTHIKSEYRCETKWQKAPTVVSGKTGAGYENFLTTFVEFEKPIILNGAAIYGVGGEDAAEGITSSGSDLGLWSAIVLLRKEVAGSVTKFSFGVLSQSSKLSPAVTYDIRKAIKGAFGIDRTGFIIVNQASGESAYQRAPTPADTVVPTWLKPWDSVCRTKESKREVDLFSENLGKFAKPW